MNRAVALDPKGEFVSDSRISAAIGVIFFVIATALGAYIRIPVKGSPVPITFQTFFVLLSGAVLGKRLGLVSQFAYLALGMMGLPIFQGYSFGVQHIFGPTGGYIAGFLAASFTVGRILQDRAEGIYRPLIAFLAGSFMIYLFGTAWLICIYKINPYSAVTIGILPFIPGDLIKIALALAVFFKISKRSRQIFTL
jgi:biotin transport system substrate-specific component